jgi:hypothetical protein
MKSKQVLLLCFGFIFFIVLACNLPAQFASDQVAESAARTIEANLTREAVSLPPAEPSATASQSFTETPTLEPTNTPVTPTPTIEHVMHPSEPPAADTYVTDLSSKSLAAERRAIADNFGKNLFERPFTSQVMDYQPYLDITKTELAYAAPWFYVTLFLEGEPPVPVTATYGIELDLDEDGRGDWYISGLVPEGSDWTTDGVRAWTDTNNDVGGANPINADAPVPSLDGYDKLVFDQGQGTDPDAAWIRRDPASSSRVQLAFKSSLIGAVSKFVFGGWSDEGVKQPGWLDYNDHFTLAEAGSPANNSSEYPIKELASLDNTCRWPYGFTPTKAIPGLCQQPKPTPTATTHPGNECPPPPPNGCPVFGSFSTHWNPVTCQCEPSPSTCQPPPGGCPVTAPFVWNPVTCQCELP